MNNGNKLALLLVVTPMMTACSIIGPGERGVSVSFGKASKESMEPGMYFWFPVIRGIKTINVQIQKTEIDAAAATKDLQETQTHVALNWHVAPADVSRLYTEIGDEDTVVKTVIIPAFNEVLKQATSKKTAEEVLSRRVEMKTEIDTELIERLKKYGVFVDEVNIVNVTFGAEFSKAIEDKQVAEQASKQAHYKALQSEQEAIGEVNRAKGQAEAQKMLRASVDDALLRLKTIEKWDGHLPTMMGAGPLPFLKVKN